ncbi:MAG: hypothetical protein ACE5EY_12745, partial [Anaerolineae bacterium]
AQFVKVSFHGAGQGIGDYMKRLDAAGVPFAIKSTDNAGFAMEGAKIARASGLPHNIVLRYTSPGNLPHDIPNYRKSPKAAAADFWDELIKSIRKSPEIAPYKDLIWIETVNEARTQFDNHDPNFNNMHPVDWLGELGFYIAENILNEGYKACLFGMNAGTPEPDDWKQPGMRKYLELAAANPEKVAVSVHEGKIEGFRPGLDILSHPSKFQPYLVGRFEYLFAACDAMKLRRPTTFISEWAWKYNTMPVPERAIEDVKWVAEFIAKYPEIRGLFLWNLAPGREWAGLPGKLAKLIPMVTDFAIKTRFPDPGPSQPINLPGLDDASPVDPGPVDPEPVQPETTVPEERGKPRVPFSRTYVLLPPKANQDWAVAVMQATWNDRRYTVGGSPDDAGVGDLADKTVIAINPSEWGAGEDGKGLKGFFEKYYPTVKYKTVTAVNPNHLIQILKKGV